MFSFRSYTYHPQRNWYINPYYSQGELFGLNIMRAKVIDMYYRSFSNATPQKAQNKQKNIKSSLCLAWHFILH